MPTPAFKIQIANITLITIEIVWPANVKGDYYLYGALRITVEKGAEEFAKTFFEDFYDEPGADFHTLKSNVTSCESVVYVLDKLCKDTPITYLKENVPLPTQRPQFKALM